ncbi:winged helix-turn-helix transcriptional regulator [bacterium]|nr:winged helix-turn-helix transcriptional regulator [candidate division CSSED10-310 bacterium]
MKTDFGNAALPSSGRTVHHNQMKGLLRMCRNPDALRRSPLLEAEIVDRVLISADHAGVDDRLEAIREIVEWCIEQLAPVPVDWSEGIGVEDPFWHDERWARYLSVRVGIVDPLPVDDRPPGVGRTSALIDRMGLTGKRDLYRLHHRALRDLTRIWGNDLQTATAVQMIQERILSNRTNAIRTCRDVWGLLGIASVFHRAFHRDILIRMARSEHLHGISKSLDMLVTRGCIISLDGGRFLMVPEPVKRYVGLDQKPEIGISRHHQAAEYCRHEGRLPDCIRHLQVARRQQEACRLIKTHWGVLNSGCEFDELIGILTAFDPSQLDDDSMLHVLALKGSLLIRYGHLDAAREVFSLTVHRSRKESSRLLAHIFLGHICSRIDPDAAERHYSFALNHLETCPQLTQFLYSSLGRFHLFRDDTETAERYLTEGLTAPELPHLSFRSVLLFALADLLLMKGDLNQAQAVGRELVVYCREQSDAHLTAMALGMQGKIFMESGYDDEALVYLEESERLHQQRMNRSEVSRILGYKARIHGRNKRIADAVTAYGDALDEAMRAGGLTRDMVELHSELARILAVSGDMNAARHHWMASVSKSRRLGIPPPEFREMTCENMPVPDSPAVRKAMEWVERHGSISSAELGAIAGIGRTTACLTLNRLIWSGVFVRHGHGRATRYRIYSNDPGPGLATESHRILAIIRRLGYATASLIARRTTLSLATAKRRLAELVRHGFIIRIGRGRTTRYIIPFNAG